MRLRDVLSGASTEPPDEWVVSRVCEEFRCLPSQAVRELEDHDASLVMTILHMRTYARAKAEFDGAERKGDLKMPRHLLQLVIEVEEEALSQALKP